MELWDEISVLFAGENSREQEGKEERSENFAETHFDRSPMPFAAVVVVSAEVPVAFYGGDASSGHRTGRERAEWRVEWRDHSALSPSIDAPLSTGKA